MWTNIEASRPRCVSYYDTLIDLIFFFVYFILHVIFNVYLLLLPNISIII